MTKTLREPSELEKATVETILESCWLSEEILQANVGLCGQCVKVLLPFRVQIYSICA